MINNFLNCCKLELIVTRLLHEMNAGSEKKLFLQWKERIRHSLLRINCLIIQAGTIPKIGKIVL